MRPGWQRRVGIGSLVLFVLVIIVVEGASLLRQGVSGQAWDVHPLTMTPPAGVALTKIAGGLAQPVFVTGAGDNSGRLFVLEQGGQIRIVKNGVLSPTPFLDITKLVTAGGEQGLLGLAFHPNYATDGRFYVYYNDTTANHQLTIAQYQVSPSNPDQADPNSAKVLLTIAHGQAANHNGGMLVFGPDGDLYAGTGDGGGAGGQFGYSQDLGSDLAKILRLDVDHPSGGKLYGTAGNPFVNTPGANPEIWAYGLRNPWRFSFDAQTGNLWIGDVGQALHEEIDMAPAGVGGQNYGWNLTEGFHCYGATSCNVIGFTPPVAEYGHDLGCAVVGGYVVRGGPTTSAALRGQYLFSDNCSGRIWALAADGSLPQVPVQVANTGLPITSFGRGDDGTLYVVDLAGSLLRVDAGPFAAASTAPASPTGSASGN